MPTPPGSAETNSAEEGGEGGEVQRQLHALHDRIQDLAEVQVRVASAVEDICKNTAQLPALVAATLVAKCEHGRETPTLSTGASSGSARQLELPKDQAEAPPSNAPGQPAAHHSVHATLELRPELDGDLGATQALETTALTVQDSRRFRSLQFSSPEDSRFSLHPNCWQRTCFELVSLVVVLYDSVTVPLAVAYNLEVQGVLYVIACVVTVFWTTDMLLSFITGYVDGDRLVMSIPLIARHYLRSSFILDLLIVACDIATLVSAKLHGVSSPGTFKVTRCLKLGRIVRITAKLSKGLFIQMDYLITMLAEKLGMAQHMQFVIMFFRLIALILWVNHIMACAWYFVASEDMEWLAAAGMPYEDGLPGIQAYPVGLYWAVSTMLGSASFILPSTMTQSFFVHGYIVLSALVMTSFTSVLAAMLMDVQMEKQEHVRQLRVMRAYLKQRSISKVLTQAIKRDVATHFQKEAFLQGEDVAALAVISPQLRKDLSWELHSWHFTSGNALFRACSALDLRAIRLFCAAASEMVATPGEVVFTPGKELEQSYIVIKGDISYLHISHMDTGNVSTSAATRVSCVQGVRSSLATSTMQSTSVGEAHRQRWVAELALWLRWHAQGLLTVIDKTFLVSIDAKGVAAALWEFPRLRELAESFARTLCRDINETGLGRLSDLEAPDSDAVLSALSVEEKQMVSAPLLDILMQGQNSTRAFPGMARLPGISIQVPSSMRRFLGLNKRLEVLTQEIKAGKCVLVMDENGAPLRIVQLIALRLKRADDFILVKLAEIGGDSEPRVEIPGRKVQPGKVPREALRQLLQEDMPGLCDLVEFPDACEEVCISHSGSRTLGLHSKYVKRLYHANLLDVDTSPYLPPPVTFDDGWSGVEAFALESKRQRFFVYAWMPEAFHSHLQRQGPAGLEDVARRVQQVVRSLSEPLRTTAGSAERRSVI